MLIGQLAQLAGTTPKAIRLYETKGLLGSVPRNGVYRTYSDKHLTQVRLIRQAQGMGFKLADVAQSMHSQRAEPDWARMAEMVDARRVAIAQQIQQLRQLDRQLQAINVEILSCAESA
ncbi:MAG: MerR family transcriptional regulator [Rhodoferax sp.]|nr:MerR family transcriptional regulator [Rhodoferax sp.]